jgi:hypothetical protein
LDKTKVGIKINILYDRMIELWDGGEATPSSKLKAGEYNDNSNNPARIKSSDYVEPSSNGGFPPQPIVQSKGYDT